MVWSEIDDMSQRTPTGPSQGRDLVEQMTSVDYSPFRLLQSCSLREDQIFKKGPPTTWVLFLDGLGFWLRCHEVTQRSVV